MATTALAPLPRVGRRYAFINHGFRCGGLWLSRASADARTPHRGHPRSLARGGRAGRTGLGSTRAIHEAEKAAIHAIEVADRGPAWDEVRRNLFGLTESGGALVSWKAEHGEIGHKAEDAAFMAALGLVAGNLIGKEPVNTLVRPMSEALPWLLPEENQPVA